MDDKRDKDDTTQRDMTTRQAAEQLNVSLRTLQRMIADDEFPNAYKRRNRWYITFDDLCATDATTRHDTDDRRDIRDKDDTTPATTTTSQQDTTTPKHDKSVRTNSDADFNVFEAEKRNTAVTDDDTPHPSTSAPAEPQQLAPDYRYRLQIDWPRLGVRFEYRKMMDERLIRDAFVWLGRKWAEWKKKQG